MDGTLDIDCYTLGGGDLIFNLNNLNYFTPTQSNFVKLQENTSLDMSKLKEIINCFFNRSSRRKRGMASNPLFIIPDLFLHFFAFSQ